MEPPSCQPWLTASRKRSGSFGGRTAGRRAATAALCGAALTAALGCGEPAGLPLSAPRIDYADGALEPVLVRGSPLLLEGFGFGAVRGIIRFTAAGGTVDALVPDSASWSDEIIRSNVPAAAVSGPLTVITAGGLQLTIAVHVVALVPFDPTGLSWQPRTAFPRAPVGVALAVAEFPSGNALSTTLLAAGGAEPLGGDSVFLVDSGVYVTPTQPGGAIGVWTRQSDLPAPRAFAAAAAATRYNSRFDGSALYLIGGIDATGRPQQAVYVGRIGVDGRIDGWYAEPPLPAARAYGGGVVLEQRIVAFGGVADSVPPGGGLDSTPARLATSDAAPISPASGFLTAGWNGAGVLLSEGRSQFATLDLGTVVMAVGGFYKSVRTAPVEALAATVTAGTDSLGAFTGPVGAKSIADLGGGTLVGPAGATWRDSDGTRHGLVLGGFDLNTRLRKNGVWGF